MGKIEMKMSVSRARPYTMTTTDNEGLSPE